jgi:cytochrome P450
MPFGGGCHICPGRRFAKVVVLLTVAMMALWYDIELLSDVKSGQMSMRNFGFGTLGPKGRIAVRMRRRGI